MNFLYISTTGRNERPYLDPSVRYRCYNPAEDLTNMGHMVDVISFNAFKINMIKNYDIFIFHRPPYDEQLEIALAVMDKYNKLYFADYDDLIFAPEYALQSSIYKTGRADKKKTLEIFKKNFKAMKMFTRFTVSTEPLKEVIINLNKNAEVAVVHNGLAKSWVHSIEKKGLNKNISKFKRISYLSGTKSHDHDFEIVSKTIAALLKKNDLLTLMLVGPLEYDKEVLNNKVNHLRYVEYKKLPELINKSWLNIAPLEDNIFNRCKSGLKFFESAILGVPSIVSSLPDFERFGEAVIIAKNENDWLREIENLYSDENYYQQKSKEVQKYSLENCMSYTQTEYFSKLVKEIL